MAATATRRRKPREPEPETLTASEAAKALRISRTHIYELMNSGELPYEEVSPKCRRINRAKFEAWRLSRQKN